MTPHGTRTRYVHQRCRCDPCKAANSSYVRSHYLQNRQKILAQVRTYRAANTEAITKYNANNRERKAAYNRAYRLEHKEEFSAYRANRREEFSIYMRAYRQKHPELIAAASRRYRARKASVLHIPFTHDQLVQRLSIFHGCWMCGAAANEVDHVKPVSVGGAHILANLRPACRSCNAAKGNRWKDDQETHCNGKASEANQQNDSRREVRVHRRTLQYNQVKGTQESLVT